MLQIQQLNYDLKQKRGMVTFGDIIISFPMETTGNETQNQIDAALKSKVKELLQHASGLC